MSAQVFDERLQIQLQIGDFAVGQPAAGALRRHLPSSTKPRFELRIWLRLGWNNPSSNPTSADKVAQLRAGF